MAMDGLLALVCAGALAAAGPSGLTATPPGDDHDSSIASTLAVQAAMQQGRDNLLHQKYKEAVDALEAQLPHINGNTNYLNLLLEAYRSFLNELRLNKQDAQAQEYHRRLLILEPGNGGGVRLSGAPTTLASAPKPNIVRG